MDGIIVRRYFCQRYVEYSLCLIFEHNELNPQARPIGVASLQAINEKRLVIKNNDHFEKLL